MIRCALSVVVVIDISLSVFRRNLRPPLLQASVLVILSACGVVGELPTNKDEVVKLEQFSHLLFFRRTRRRIFYT